MNKLIFTGLIALAISYDVLAEKCPDGWGSNGQWEPVDGLCYRNAGNYGRNHWDESIKACQDLGGIMVEPRTDAQRNKLTQILYLLYPTIPADGNLWIGLTDQAEEGVFRWLSDNSTVDYDMWAVGQPDNGGILGGPQNCANMLPALLGYWDDTNCDSYYGMANLCQIAAIE